MSVCSGKPLIFTPTLQTFKRKATNVQLATGRNASRPAPRCSSHRMGEACRYLIKSLYSIQKTPSLLPCGMSSARRCPGQCGHSSDQLPFQEKRPHGFRSRRSLWITGLRTKAVCLVPTHLSTLSQLGPYLEP